MDPYATLGVEQSASDQDIKAAFKKLARQFHPDLHPDDKEAEALGWCLKKYRQLLRAHNIPRNFKEQQSYNVIATVLPTTGRENPRSRY